MMLRRTRDEMITETRAKLIAAGRKAFAEKGYADASMDDFTAEAGLTRGALYHHFGGKPGLLAAVIAQIDGEMAQKLSAEVARTSSRWEGFLAENLGYLRLALDPEIRRTVLREGPAVLGDPATWPTTLNCVNMIASTIAALQAEGVVREMDPEAAARLVTGASTYAAQWIANSADPDATLAVAVPAFQTMLEGLRR